MSEQRTVAFITGAAQGIGAATALEFARRGYDCYLLDIDPTDLRKRAAEVESIGAKVAFSAGDLADLDLAQQAVNDCVATFGRLDVLVNNAAWREVITMKSISLDSWEKTLRVCLTAPAFLARWTIDTNLSSEYRTSSGESLSDEMRQVVEEMIPLQRYADPREIAKSIVALSGTDASYITGTCIEIDGGWFHQCSPYKFKRLQFPEDYPERS